MEGKENDFIPSYGIHILIPNSEKKKKKIMKIKMKKRKISEKKNKGRKELAAVSGK